jgi:signal recognition particle subunit SRP19
MKDYEHVIVWLDYFNKTLTRSKGRKLEKEKCVFDPSLKEITEAAHAAGFDVTATDEKVRFPRRPYVRSGYITLAKGSAKRNMLNKISEKLVLKRAKQSK